MTHPEQLAGVVRWMMVRACQWPTRYQAEAVALDTWRARSLEEAVALLTADACAELGLEPSEALDLAAERVWVWVGRGRVSSRTYRRALEVLPLAVVQRAVLTSTSRAR